MPKSRVTLTELAAAAGVTVNAIRYRVQRGQMTRPDRQGRFDRARALGELAVRRKQRGGRKAGSPTQLADVAPTVRRDPEWRFRLARARQEEIKLRRLRGELLPRDSILRIAEVWARVWRDALLAFPTSAAEEVAAELGVAPQLVIIVLERMIRQFLEEMSKHTFRMADEANEGDGEEP